MLFCTILERGYTSLIFYFPYACGYEGTQHIPIWYDTSFHPENQRWKVCHQPNPPKAITFVTKASCQRIIVGNRAGRQHGRLSTSSLIEWLSKTQQFHSLKLLRQSDAYLRQHNKPTLVQILACRLFGNNSLSEPMLANWTLGKKLKWNFDRNWNIFIQENAFENVVWKMAAILSRSQCVKLPKPWKSKLTQNHYGDVIMGTMTSQIISLSIGYSTVYSDADQRKHHSPASLAFVWGTHRGPVNSPHKWPVTRKMFPFDDVIMSYRDFVLLTRLGHG